MSKDVLDILLEIGAQVLIPEQRYLCQQRQLYMKRDLQKRPTKETYKRDLHCMRKEILSVLMASGAQVLVLEQKYMCEKIPLYMKRDLQK